MAVPVGRMAAVLSLSMKHGLWIVGIAFACFIYWCLCLLADKGKFSSPSLSVSASRWRRSFIRLVTVREKATAHDGTKRKVPVKAAWLEYRFERYESFPINRRKAGVRLCVRFDDPDDVLTNCFGEIEMGIPNLFEKHNSKISSKDIVVFEFLAPDADKDDFPTNGSFVIGNRKFVKDPIEVYATYEFLPFESVKFKNANERS